MTKRRTHYDYDDAADDDEDEEEEEDGKEEENNNKHDDDDDVDDDDDDQARSKAMLLNAFQSEYLTWNREWLWSSPIIYIYIYIEICIILNSICNKI